MRPGKKWYAGTADAIYQNMNLLRMKIRIKSVFLVQITFTDGYQGDDAFHPKRKAC
ncbi:MAG: hypothetical protein Ct9H300mP28_14960 [Pseudomonadota bacterium]|nr:MAG: hypothetical protein Ct9H300mP28_14960 [Pseudomonadota bacterium]